MIDVFQTAIFGLVTGSIVALNAVGLTLSYRIIGIINFAYGEFLSLSTYLTIFLVLHHSPLLVACVLSTFLTGIIGVLIAHFFYEPLRERGLFPVLVTSLGIAFILQNVIRMVAGSNPLSFPVPLYDPLILGGLVVPFEGILVFLTAGCMMGIISMILRYTRIGKMMRALADDEELAKASAIPVRRVRQVTWFMSASIAGIGGILLSFIQITATPDMGFHFLLIIFAAVLLGGIGSPYGAFISGLILGMVIEFTTSYIAPDYGYAFAFIVLLGILLFRPQGLFPYHT